MILVPLGEVAAVKSGFAFKSKDWRDNGVPVIKIANVKEGSIAVEGCSFVSEETAASASSFELLRGDILISMTGYIGQVAKVRNEGRLLLNQRVGKFRIRNPQRLDSEYLFQWLRLPEVRASLEARAHGAAQPNISPTAIEQQLIPLPSLPSQRRIASILSTYDDLIENNTRRIAILEEMARRLYEEWFVRFRFPGHENVRMVESELGLVPEHWCVVPLAEMVDTQYGYTESAQDKPIGPKFLRGMDINKQPYIDWSAVPYCPISAEEFPKYKLSVGDVLVIRMADPGKIGIIEKEIDAVFASYLVRLRITDARMTPYFLFYFLTGERYQGYITGVSTGTTRKSASAPVITGVKVVMPVGSLLGQFSEHVVPLRRLMNNLLDKNTNLRITRDLLLPKLISGELDVSALPEAATA